MATLEDKLLGEKLEYYCSSSSDEENEIIQPINENNNIGRGTSSRYQNSTNTGPKAVIEDWQYYKKLQAEDREIDERQRLELAKKLAITTLTAAEEDERKRQEEFDAEFNELLSEDILEEFKQKCSNKIMQQKNSTNYYSQVFNLGTREEFLDCIEKEDKDTLVVIHIYDGKLNACRVLSKCLETLAFKYSKIKFAKISSACAGMSWEFRNSGLPALLIYKGQVLIGNYVRITDQLSDDFFTSDVENLLIEDGILN